MHCQAALGVSTTTFPLGGTWGANWGHFRQDRPTRPVLLKCSRCWGLCALGSLGPPPSVSEPDLCSLYSIYITVQAGLPLQCRKGWKITVVPHLEQLTFSPNSPTPFSKGSLSVNEEEEVAHWLFCTAELVLHDFNFFSDLKMHSHGLCGSQGWTWQGWGLWLEPVCYPACSVTSFFPPFFFCSIFGKSLCSD